MFVKDNTLKKKDSTDHVIKIMIVSLRASSSQSAVISTTWLTQIHKTHSYLMRYFGSLVSWTWQKSDFMLVLIGLLNYAVSESAGSLSGCSGALVNTFGSANEQVRATEALGHWCHDSDTFSHCWLLKPVVFHPLTSCHSAALIWIF